MPAGPQWSLGRCRSKQCPSSRSAWFSRSGGGWQLAAVVATLIDCDTFATWQKAPSGSTCQVLIPPARHNRRFLRRFMRARLAGQASHLHWPFARLRDCSLRYGYGVNVVGSECAGGRAERRTHLGHTFTAVANYSNRRCGHPPPPHHPQVEPTSGGEGRYMPRRRVMVAVRHRGYVTVLQGR